MRKTVCLGLALVLAAAAGLVWGQEQPKTAADVTAISFDNWLAAKMKAEQNDKDGKYVEALQYYFEYCRQAQGLGRPDLVAWGKNNAAYMIIKRHKLDATVDLAPARKLLEEAMDIAEASEDCKKCLALNLEYVNLFLKK
jgi:hypothetical protein